MLRVETKDNILRIINNVITMCEKAIARDNTILIPALQEAQDAIIALGECIEKEVDDVTEVISMLERLCELFYLLSENMQDKEVYFAQIKEQLEQIVSIISKMQMYYQVVFFPYKADMWDSLESIWLACKEEPRCDCKVVPIPYYHFDAKKNEWLYRYEIDRFPSYVPVISYEEYSLEEKPDVAFIHNPYDQYNNVTHVHSDYYSYNLKKYVKKLFYVPYYVKAGAISPAQKVLSVYPNADYIIVQSESFKEGLMEYTYGKKAQVLGSPKLDRVIRMCENKGNAPEEWENILNGRKSLMLNTSLNHFLYDGEAYLQKLAYLFDVIQMRKNVAIIWRPHPLLLSTIESMRPHLLEEYLRLKKFFVDNQIGIFDTTPDVTNTVAIADAYVGEWASSVMNLFLAVGKPVFVPNNYVSDVFSGEEKRDFLLADCEKIDNELYCNSLEGSGVWQVEDDLWDNIQLQASTQGVPKWLPAGGHSLNNQGVIYYAPNWAEEFFLYDTKKNEVKTISAIKGKRTLDYNAVVLYNTKIFYLPKSTKYIAEYDTKEEVWREHYAPIKALQTNIEDHVFEDTYNCFVEGKYLWVTNLYSNRILRFDMENANYLIYEIGSADMRYSAIAATGNILYLADATTGNIICWDVNTKAKIGEYPMPEAFRVHRNIQGRMYAHSNLWIADDCLVTSPGTSNGVVKVDLKTGRTELLVEEFWTDVFEAANYYKYEVHGVVNFAKMIDEDTLLIQKRRDASLLELNVHTGEYKIHHPKLAPGEIEKLLEGQDGFEKSYSNGAFSRCESKFFSFEDFLDDLVNDRLGDAMARQKQEMQTMAVNLDGTCGEKVHQFMMEVLTQE